ncbi:MAG: S26 family signal peptidase, partial [Novipirellula sp. JB048]
AITVTASSPTRFEVAFFSEAGPRFAQRNLAANQAATIHISDAILPADSGQPDAPTAPARGPQGHAIGLTLQSPIGIRTLRDRNAGFDTVIDTVIDTAFDSPADTAEIDANSANDAGKVQLQSLIVQRSVEYRLRRRDSAGMYPLRLKPGECFVVGDNVPISVDSREFGPVPIEDIAGGVRHPSAEADLPSSR